MCLCVAATALPQDDSTQPQPRHESVIVTGTYEPIPLEEADRSVRAIDVEGLLLVSNSLADVLQLDSSLDLRQRAPGGIQGDLSIRGSTFGQTLILLDGIRLNDVQSGHHNLDVPLPLSSIERVEVLKGAGSTLYGSDAVGGVVNLITRRPETTEVRLRGGAGNWGRNEERGDVAFVVPRVTELLSFSRDFSSGFIPDRDYRDLSMASTTYIDSGVGSTRLTLANMDRPFGADQFYGNYHSWERTRTWFAAASQSLGTRTDAAFAYRRHTDLFVLERDRPELFTNRHAVEGIQAILRRHDPLGRNAKLFYGAEGYRDSIASNNLGRHDRARGAVYAALDVRALRRFSLNAGIRDEIYGSFNHEWSPSVSGGVWLGAGWKLRGAVSHAFRLPTYTDLYYHDPANLGSPDLRPERAWSYEGGLDWNRGGRFRGSFTVFERRERDGIDYVRSSADAIWRARNFQRLRFAGVEAGFTARLGDSQRFDVEYTGLLGARDQLSGVESKYSFNYPIHSGLVSWEATVADRMIARLRVGALERYARDPYAVVDLYAARAHGRCRPFLQLTNLSDAAYQEILGVPMPGSGILGGIELLLYGSR